MRGGQWKYFCTWFTLHLTIYDTSEADLTRCSRTSYYLSGNNTHCPHISPVLDFGQYGLPGDAAPSHLSDFRPSLLHERSVIHHVDMHKAFVEVGSGHEGRVYRAELRGSQTPVIVKTLQSKNFAQIYHEANVLTYLSELASVPKLVGLLPTGPVRHNLSIVSEYVKNSSTIGVWFNKSNKVSKCNWVDISHQIAVSLKSIHEKQILHNDLHHKNILIQWKGSTPRVYFIDFGDSTFRHGRAVKNFNPYQNKSYQLYLPPEVAHDQSTPASDVYSVGQHLRVIANLSQVEQLARLAKLCLRKDPALRLHVTHLVHQLKRLLLEHCPAYSEDTVNGINSNKVSSNSRHKALHHIPLPILQLTDFIILEHFENTNLDSYTATHRPTGEMVSIQSFNYVDFDYIRHCARVNLYLNDTGYVPWFKGIVFIGEELSDLALVQQPILDGISFSNFIHDSNFFSEEVRINVLREIAKALLTLKNRHIGCSEYKIDGILLDLNSDKPRVLFTDLWGMYYDGYETKESQVSITSREQNTVSFTEIIARVIPEIHPKPCQQLSVNVSSILLVDFQQVADWTFSGHF